MRKKIHFITICNFIACVVIFANRAIVYVFGVSLDEIDENIRKPNEKFKKRKRRVQRSCDTGRIVIRINFAELIQKVNDSFNFCYGKKDSSTTLHLTMRCI